MNPIALKYAYRENCANSKVRLIVGQLSVQARVAPHPLFAQVKQIQLKGDQFNTKCIQLLQNGFTTIAAEKSKDFVKRCREVFGVQPQLDALQLSMALMLSNNEQDSKILDTLQFGDLLSVVKLAFDKTGLKLHTKVLRKLKNYIKNSKRQAAQKTLLENIAKSYKESQNLDENQKQIANQKEQPQLVSQTKKNVKPKVTKNTEKVVKTQKQQNANEDDEITTFSKLKNAQKGEQLEDDDEEEQSTSYNSNNKNIRNQSKKSSNKEWEDDKARRNKGRRNKRSYQQTGQERSRSKRQQFSQSKQRYDRGSSANKQKVDPKILLGISGDTQYGWRQRNRPTRVPPRKNLTVDDGNASFQKQIKKNISQPLYKQVFKKQNMRKQSGDSKNFQNKKNKSSRPSSRQNLDQLQKKQTKKQENVQVSIPARQIDEKDAKVLQDAKLTDNKQMKLIYIFPKYGTNFDFKRLKQEFLLLINGSIWVKYKDGSLTITKGDNGYVRQTKIDLLADGFMAEGFTLKLEGNSNIQDGGDTIGTPNIQQFTGSTSQFFHVITLEVYVPK